MNLKLELFQKDLFYLINRNKCEKQTNTTINNNVAYPNYPYYDFPTLVQKFETLITMREMNVYDGLHVTKNESYDIEKKYNRSIKNPFWKSTHKYRLTSSCFNELGICSQKKEHESLANRLISGNKM